MFFTFIIVVILTAIVLVVAAMTIAKLLLHGHSIRRRENRTNVVFLRVDNHGCNSRQVTTCLLSCS